MSEDALWAKDSEVEKARETSQDPKKGLPRDWESVIEKQIREAMERGEFESLPGRGKPLDLSADPNVPPEWDLAFKMLKDAGFAPEWIEEDKQIRAGRERVFKAFQTYLRQPHKPPANRTAREARLIADFRREAAELNRLIDLFNLKAPSPRLHHARIRIEEEVEKFREAIEEGQV